MQRNYRMCLCTTIRVCHQMAEHAQNNKRDYEEAIRQYKEALQVHPEDEVNIL